MTAAAASLDHADAPCGKIYLHPGQLTVSANPCEMTTILGSCVSVCLHDPEARIGGLNHYLLPRSPVGRESLRFGDAAVRQLIEEMRNAGAKVARLVAKVVGGACVLDAYRGGRSHIGRQNVEVALEILSKAHIKVVATEIEGDRGRRLVFHPHTGDLMVRSL